MDEALTGQLSGGQYSGSGAMSIGGLKQTEEHVARHSYSMPGILHFLQTEWARFEMERAQWDVEKAEFQARIAFLQGERKGQENLKRDLVRRIKMLEYALKQERAKLYKLKFGKELIQGDMKPPQFDEDEKDDSLNEDALNEQNSNVTWKQGRQLLRQYLQEIGYTDTIIDVRSARVRQLLGVQGTDSEDGRPMVNGEGPQKRASDLQSHRITGKKLTSVGERALNDTEKSVIATFEFLNNQYSATEDDDNVDDEDLDEEEAVSKDKRLQNKLGNEALAMDVLADPEAEVMAEFDDFLATEGGEGAGEARSTDSTDWDKKDEDWRVDEQLISKLKEQYKQERPKGKKPVQMPRPKRADLKAMLDNLGNENEMSPNQTQGRNNNNTEGEESVFPDDESYEGALVLGELAELNDYSAINNDADINYDISANKKISRKSWTAKYTLRSHFDGIRALAFHPVEPVLITASEDHTLKLWNLQKTVQAKKTASLDVEPVYTFRAHQGPVLCLEVNSSGEACYSGGVDSTIRCWNLPSSNIDPYDSFNPAALSKTLVAHTDAVWSLSIHSSKRHLLSCSSDGTVRLWEPDSKSPLLNTYRVEDEKGVPASVDFVRCVSNQMVAGYTSANAHLFDIETSQKLLTLDSKVEDGGLHSQINRIISHPTLSTTITAHEDRSIRFFDNNSGKMIHSMTAHLEAVTSLAVDPNGLYLLSASHDSSVRLWNLSSRTCVQELTLHRKKFDESIHDVAFHPSKPYLASAGADALAKVYV